MKVNYDAIASGYDRRYRDNDYSGVERALEEFAGAASGRVLEVGCGTGHWVRALIDRGVRAHGVDASTEMLARARAALLRAVVVRARSVSTRSITFRTRWDSCVKPAACCRQAAA
jgi:cyclopropane fatty-acyl-phospholipid synthase-like methyltransferase